MGVDIYIYIYFYLSLSVSSAFSVPPVLSVNLSIYLSIHPSVCLSIHPSIHLSIYLSISGAMFAVFLSFSSRGSWRVLSVTLVRGLAGRSWWISALYQARGFLPAVTAATPSFRSILSRCTYRHPRPRPRPHPRPLLLPTSSPATTSPHARLSLPTDYRCLRVYPTIEPKVATQCSRLPRSLPETVLPCVHPAANPLPIRSTITSQLCVTAVSPWLRRYFLTVPAFLDDRPVATPANNTETALSSDATAFASIMINIAHRRIVGKPPSANGSLPAARDEEIRETREIPDGNRNVCSFEQLCDMITELERDITDKLPSNLDFDNDSSERDLLFQLEPEKDRSEGMRPGEHFTTTYDDIMSFLTNLEDGSPGEANVPEVEGTILEEIFGNSPQLSLPSVSYDSVARPTFKEDLATALLQLEEKDAAISVLKEELKSERNAAREKLEGEKKRNGRKFHEQEEKYKGIVRRHQKFIEELISEKTVLTEKCNSLAQRVKEIEMKMERDSKAAADRHAVELQKAKERFAAAEKIKRERWIEARTTKIKEMTVKGLEPELRNIMERHAEEIQRLRNVHAKELQDTELRIVRRSNEQLEQLRLELTASHERMLSNETNILRARYQEKLEQQENMFETQRTKLSDELRLAREKFEEEQAKRDAEREDSLQRVHSRYQQEIETLKQQHSNEKIMIRESLKVEWEAWLADYNRQQRLRMEQTENKIREECYRERDRQIELVIERLEKDSRNAKFTLEQNFDRKFRTLKEKFELDLRTATDNEQVHKGKLIEATDALEKTKIELDQTEAKLQQLTSELSNANQVIARLSVEKDDARKLARQEIEGEKRDLEEKIASLYQEITRMDRDREESMARIHSRIKLVMTQKVLTIKNLTKELNDAKSKMKHLEKLLDQQRKEYILKSL
ncbi:centrosomal protein dilatory [Xylocopa sonorina]|uniref:centrosomal protein dilatory n=1 Tax=Xylocopa sonorina TaxID=1818115 RepID=UPI00403AD3BD